MNRFVSWLKSVLGKKKKFPSCASCEFWGTESERLNNHDYRHCMCDRDCGNALKFTHRDVACLWLKIPKG